MKLLIVLLSMLALSACDNGSEPAAQKDVKKATVVPTTPAVVVDTKSVEVEPLKEVASQVVEQVELQAAKLSGKKIFMRSCVSCHGTGVAGSPKVGDKAAWAPRIAKGMDALVTSAIKGVPGTAMMARGTCAGCSDDELRSVVEYMVTNSQ